MGILSRIRARMSTLDGYNCLKLNLFRWMWLLKHNWGDSNAYFQKSLLAYLFMEFKPTLSPVVKQWLSAHQYTSPSFLAKGQSGSVWKVEKNGKHFALKVEHEHSTRTRMIEKEAQLLRMANQLNVGPKVADVDIEQGIIVMDFVNGIPLAEWIEKCESRVQMERGLTRLFSQVRKLDKAGIDHGQLAGKLHNILMGEGDQPTIIDFEKASYVRGVHNVNTLKDILLGGRTVHAKKILLVWPTAKEELHF